jgi:replicative superfamily II helicase
MTVFKRAGINIGEIPHEIQYFLSITDFKEAKAVIIATFHNTQITWNRVTENLRKQEKKISDLSKEDLEKVAKECYVKPEFVQTVINALKGGEEE